jgi:hypothetical protein
MCYPPKSGRGSVCHTADANCTALSDVLLTQLEKQATAQSLAVVPRRGSASGPAGGAVHYMVSACVYPSLLGGQWSTKSTKSTWTCENRIFVYLIREIYLKLACRIFSRPLQKFFLFNDANKKLPEVLFVEGFLHFFVWAIDGSRVNV